MLPLCDSGGWVLVKYENFTSYWWYFGGGFGDGFCTVLFLAPPLHLASSASPSFLGSHKPSAAPPHPTIDYQSILRWVPHGESLQEIRLLHAWVGIGGGFCGCCHYVIQEGEDVSAFVVFGAQMRKRDDEGAGVWDFVWRVWVCLK